MTKYRKKSATIEAVQWTGDIESIEKIDWVKEEIEKQNIIFAVNSQKDKDAVCLIPDGSVMFKVKMMDYIVKEKESIYSMNESELKERYEPIEDTSKSKTDVEVNLDIDTTEAEMKLDELKRYVDSINDIKYNAGIMRVITKDEYILENVMKGMKKDKAIEMWNKISKGYNFVLSKYSHNNYIYSVEKLNDILKEDKDSDCTHKEQEQ
ncbi:hypothetical protein UMC2_35621 [[Clostridium] sordellii]|uniref:hypothetical protein n=1 Tax=Paraclostridium sordellii TaxID=1505 RepID=UPI0005428F5E|nr:hypothetical protein [Paeniclostridium sordellii]CEK34351.1 hypothetical protein UMC2_35621 [[Clostridium] sordellii] [Paeniclostridium sordellii]